MTSDPDKQAVYYAEKVTFEETLFREPLHTSEITELAYHLFSHSWWVEKSIPVPMIKPTTGYDTSSYARIYHPHSIYSDDRDPTIHIAPNDVTAHTLAHEAAHVAQYHLFPIAMNPDIQSHGPEFQSTYLTVANILLGWDATEALAENFTRFVPSFTYRMDFFELHTFGAGIYQEWRLDKTLAELGEVLAYDGPSLRINGAIAL